MLFLRQLGNKSDYMKHCSLPPLPFVPNFSGMEGTFQRRSGIERD